MATLRLSNKNRNLRISVIRTQQVYWLLFFFVPFKLRFDLSRDMYLPKSRSDNNVYLFEGRFLNYKRIAYIHAVGTQIIHILFSILVNY